MVAPTFAIEFRTLQRCDEHTVAQTSRNPRVAANIATAPIRRRVCTSSHLFSDTLFARKGAHIPHGVQRRRRLVQRSLPDTLPARIRPRPPRVSQPSTQTRWRRQTLHTSCWVSRFDWLEKPVIKSGGRAQFARQPATAGMVTALESIARRLILSLTTFSDLPRSAGIQRVATCAWLQASLLHTQLSGR